MYMGDGKGMKEENQLYWIWLSSRFGVESKEFPSFVDKFDDPYDVYRMSDEEIEQIDGIGIRLKERLCQKELNEAYSILKYCKKNKIDIIGYTDKRYPERLKSIENPPVMLYCMGELPSMDTKLCIGMVGTRKMSEYGKQTAYKISYELAAANVCIVSGMALGVDGVSACGAIEGGGTTVAVLGGGLACVYPREHTRLMRSIVKHGAVISEFPPFERPQPQNFPKRNRLISGMCQGVVVVEGSRGSGALITASRAISQGRELFAIPGKVNESNSDGPNELIRNGANVILSSDDIIRHYEFLYHDVINYRALSNSKRRSELSDSILRSYGVSYVGGKKRFSKTDKNQEPRELNHSAQDAVNQKSQAEPEVKAVADNTNRETIDNILLGIDECSRTVYGMLPSAESFTPDAIAAKGVGMGDIMTALTILEINGLVVSLPGGAYKVTDSSIG